MFLCENCVREDEVPMFYMMVSYGNCENCRQTTFCKNVSTPPKAKEVKDAQATTSTTEV